MKINRPLVNPSPKDISDQISRERINIEKHNNNNGVNTSQMAFGMDSNPRKAVQLLNSVKHKLYRRNEFMELSGFWRYPAIPFMMVTSIFNIILLLIGGLLNFGNLPPEMQLFYNPVDGNWVPESKIFHVFVIPVMFSALFLLLYKVQKYIYIQDRRLSMALAWIISMLNIFLLIAIAQIFRLNPL